MSAYLAAAGPWAYAWPVLMLATLAATLGAVAVLAMRERRALIGQCDARHTEMGYSAARHVPNMVTSPTATSAAMGDAETE